MTDYEILKIAVKAIDDKKAQNIKIIKVQDISSLTNYFVLANGTSTTQVKAVADEVEFKLGEAGVQAHGTEGFSSATWIALDYIDVIFHIFTTDSREFYDLERLWQDGTEIDVSEFLK